MKAPAERGRYGRWLVEARQSRGLTSEQARQALAAEGLSIGKSVYAEYEAGTKNPSRTHLPRLIDYWGPIPDLGPLEGADLDYLRRIAEALERAYPPDLDPPVHRTASKVDSRSTAGRAARRGSHS